jgi:uncharacterized protein involved in exopolysaccharide biosynthesis
MEDIFSIRDVIAAFFRQFRIFFLVFLGAVSVGLLTIIIATPMYQASGSVLVKFGADADARVNNPAGNQYTSTVDRREIMQSNLDILQSHDLLKMVMEKIGIERIYPSITEQVGSNDSPLEVAIYMMERKHLTIKSSQQSNVIEISVLNSNPEVAAEIVSNIQTIFIARQLEIFNKPQTTFLQEQVTLAEERLNKSQKALRDFKASVGMSSIEEELNELLKQKSSAASVAFQAVDDAQTKLAELQDKETEMLSTYREGSPPLITLRKSIAEAERQLRERQDSLNSKNGTLSEQTSGINKRITKLEDQRNRYNDLVRQVQVDETSYKNYLARSEEARVNENLGEKKITSISVVDSPSIPVKPTTPRKKLTLLISMLAGGVLGIMCVLIREIFDESFRTPKQLSEALGLPVLTSFPKKDGAMQLFNNIEHLLANVPQPVIQFVSSYEGEGVDDIAIDLANLATSQGKNVLLVNTEQLQKDFAQIHFEFTKSHNNSWTIITSSGMLNSELGKSLAKLASGSIMVVEAERTRAPVANEVKRLIESLGGKVIGGVLVKRQMYIPAWIYNRLYK